MPVLAGVVSLLVIVDSLQGVLMGALRGCADTLIPTIIYGVSFWVIGVPAGYWWGYRAGARTVCPDLGPAGRAVGGDAQPWRLRVPAPNSTTRLVTNLDSWA